MKRILVTGASGQIGSELTHALRKEYGDSNVVATDVRLPRDVQLRDGGPFEFLDSQDGGALHRLVGQYRIDAVYHLAALLSATGEAHPARAWGLNMGSLVAVLGVARETKCKVFFPSSIGAFGPSTPRVRTPQETVMRPTTMYGVTKLAGELLCDYHFRKFGTDTRGLRFPGLISYKTEPGGGTTDYAVDIFLSAAAGKPYICYLPAGARLPMMYMPDAVRALIELMEADGKKLIHRNAYNLSAMDFTPAELGAQIAKKVPGFKVEYHVDPVRQAIAESWPESLDDSAARGEWGWKHRFDLPAMVDDMLAHLQRR